MSLSHRKSTICLACPPMISSHGDWRYSPYHTWKFAFSHGDYGYSGANLGIAAIASHLRSHGHTVHLTDGYLEEISIREQVERISIWKPDVIGITIMSNINLGDASSLARAIRDRNIQAPIIVGGHYPTQNPAAVFRSMPDICGIALGDGEPAMLELADLFCSARKPMESPRLLHNPKDLQKIHDFKFTTDDLNSYPFPARDHLDLEVSKGFVPGLVSSRACNNRCSFCAPTMYESQYYHQSPQRNRTGDSLANEVAILKDRYGLKKYKFVDLNFLNGHAGAQKAHEFHSALKRLEIDIPFMFDTRIDCLDTGLLDALREVGLWGVYLGLESITPRQLRTYRKNQTESDVRAASGIVTKSNLRLLAGTISFDPDVNISELRANFDFLIESGIFNIYRFARGLIPREGTSLFAQYSSRNLLFNDGTDYHVIMQDPDVQGLYECFNLLADLSYRVEKELHLTVKAKHSISEAAELNSQRLKHIEHYVSSFILDMAQAIIDNYPDTPRRSWLSQEVDHLRRTALSLLHEIGYTC